MRSVIWSALAGDEGLTSLGVVPGGILAGDVDTPTQRPFIQLRWLDGQRGVGVPGASHDRRILSVWVHDTPNDYTRVDQVISRVKKVFYDVVAQADNGGGFVSQIDWFGDSDDLVDDGHGTICRNSTFYVVASGM